ncbi:MAG: polymer-forming cytoskeletal protein [Gammaproteobacteria bacterium]|nr:polymer-forming cytoskeletal protein [Gammaproteobacteria bacterium]
MWGQQKKRRNGSIDTLVGKNTEVHGDIHCNGGLHIEGRVKGNVTAEDGSDAVLTLSEHGSIEGEVRVPHVVLDGTVVGDVHAAERIELAGRARVTGNVYYNLIEMAIGAEVNGSLVHQTEHPRPMLAHARGEREEPAPVGEAMAHGPGE